MGLVNRNDKWRISDELWREMERFLPPRKPHPLGCHNPPVPPRQAMNAILFVLRTGCPWEALDGTGICSHSSAHRRFQEWTRAGVFEQFWIHGLMCYEQLRGIDWEWLCLDGALTKAPLGGEKNRAQSHRPGQARHQTQPGHRRPRPSLGRGGGGCQSQRSPAGAGNSGAPGGATAHAHPQTAARPVPGQGLRL
jgi:transposase